MLALIAGIVYINFFHNRESSSPQSPAGDLKVFEGGLLPFGTKIDSRILNDDRFTSLRAAPKLSVSAEELGKSDLFRQE